MMLFRRCLGLLLAATIACGRLDDQQASASKLTPANDGSQTAAQQVSPPGRPHIAATSTSPEPLRVGGDVLPPVVVRRVQPDLTNLIGRYHSGGVPIVEATITATGDVTDVRVLRSRDPEVIAAMVAAVKQWKFRPATLHGKPVPVCFTMTMIIDVR